MLRGENSTTRARAIEKINALLDGHAPLTVTSFPAAARQKPICHAGGQLQAVSVVQAGRGARRNTHARHCTQKRAIVLQRRHLLGLFVCLHKVDVRLSLGNSAVDSWCTLTRDVLYGQWQRDDAGGAGGDAPRGRNGSLAYVRFGMTRVARSNRPESRGAAQYAHSL